MFLLIMRALERLCWAGPFVGLHGHAEPPQRQCTVWTVGELLTPGCHCCRGFTLLGGVRTVAGESTAHP